MNPDIKARWVQALRSQEYKQGQGYLRQRDTYCCLGVLCDLYGKDHNVEWTDHPDPVIVETWGVKAFLGEHGALPDDVADWAGLGTRPSVQLPDLPREWRTVLRLTGTKVVGQGANPVALVEMNDDLKWDFPRIANAIETHL